MEKIQGKIPQVRFPEFKDAWEHKKLSEIAERVIAKNKEGIDNVLTISAQYGLISQLEYFNKSVSAKDVTGYYLLKKNDFAYNKSYSNGYPMGAIKRLTRYESGVVSTLYICFRVTKECDDSFAEQYFESGNQNKEIEKVAQEGARNHGLLNIGVKEFFNIELIIPSLPEQTRIASFFRVLDKKIAQLKQKKNLLEQYKKGVMQKLFSQELRFKDENGKEFPKWEKKKLGEVSDVRDGTHDSPKYVDNGYPFITSKNLMKDGSIDLEKVTFITELDYNKFNQRSKVNINDILFGMIGTIGNPVLVKSDGFSIKNVALIKEKKELLNLFLIHFLKGDSINQQFFEQNTGGTQKFLSLSIVRNLIIEIPSIKEQTKIANFLTAIDEKINRTETQIQQTQEYKKGLLQNMFC